jgi:glycosyltransferase involved in cell wall biosynthesis
MRVVFVFGFFAKQMGYLANCLPKYLAKLGIDVHVISTDLPPYYTLPSFQQTYGGFSTGSKVCKETLESLDGFTLHILPHRRLKGLASRIENYRVVGLREKIAALEPDIVQSWSVSGWIPIDLAAANLSKRFKLCTANHIHASVFPLAQAGSKIKLRHRLEHAILRGLPARWVGRRTQRCYCISDDCADIAVRFFGTPKGKIIITPLGTDTEFFWPVHDEVSRQVRFRIRTENGVSDSEILCIYTGRFTKDKNPLLLAEAVARLRREGLPFRSMFVGSGPQRDGIVALDGAIALPFRPFCELGWIYRAADIAVWPEQESMSMIDATACGIPIVVNDTVMTKERIEGNGLAYRKENLDDLVRVLKVFYDSRLRISMGKVGAERIRGEFGWPVLAKRRIDSYLELMA